MKSPVTLRAVFLSLALLLPAHGVEHSAHSADAYPRIADSHTADGAVFYLQSLIKRHPIALRVRILPADAASAGSGRLRARVRKTYLGAPAAGDIVTYLPVATRYEKCRDEAWVMATNLRKHEDGSWELLGCTVVPLFSDGRSSQNAMSIALDREDLTTLDEEGAMNQP